MKRQNIKLNKNIIIQAKNISKLYGEGEVRTQILNKISVEFQ